MRKQPLAFFATIAPARSAARVRFATPASRQYRYEYRTEEIRRALRKHGTIASAARALRIDHRLLAKFCAEHDIPAQRDIPWYLCPGFLKLPPIAGYDELPGMLRPR